MIPYEKRRRGLDLYRLAMDEQCHVRRRWRSPSAASLTSSPVPTPRVPCRDPHRLREWSIGRQVFGARPQKCVPSSQQRKTCRPIALCRSQPGLVPRRLLRLLFRFVCAGSTCSRHLRENWRQVFPGFVYDFSQKCGLRFCLGHQDSRVI